MANVLITGANRGIGLALCQQHAQRGDRVIAVCRQPSDALRALDVRIESDVELTDATALDALAGRVARNSLDRLISCAGILRHESSPPTDPDSRESLREQFETNAIAPLCLVSALSACLLKGSKVGIITSRMGSIADNSSGGHYGYRMSKAAVNAAGRSLALDLEPQGIAVFLLHPGFVRTDMTGGKGDVDADQSAANLIAKIDALTQADSGSFWHAKGQSLPW